MKGEIDSNTLNYLAREIVKGDIIKGEIVSNNYVASEIVKGETDCSPFQPDVLL